MPELGKGCLSPSSRDTRPEVSCREIAQPSREISDRIAH